MVKKSVERSSSSTSTSTSNTFAERSQQEQQQKQKQAVSSTLEEELEQQQQEQEQANYYNNAKIDVDLDDSQDTKLNYARLAQSNYNLRPYATTTLYKHLYTQNDDQQHELPQHKSQKNYLPLQNAHVGSMHYTVASVPAQNMPVTNVGAIMPTEIPPEDEERLERIFKQLDRDGDGKIDIHDLSAKLHEFGMSSVYAEKFLQQSDRDQSGNVGFAEFLQYVREHEKNLILQFSHLDKNCDGKVDLEELISAFKDLGLDVDVEEARNLLSRMDKDGSLNISFNEWRDFMLLAASTDIHDLIKFWRHSTYIDIGEDMNVPDDFTQKEMQTGLWWRHLVAGGIAGAVSRTCTAPLDRIKVYLQVQTRKMGISDCVRLMLNEGGARSLWRGNGMNVVKIAPETAIKFAAYEHIKRLIRGTNDPTHHLSIAERFFAGALAGGISQTIIYPMEVMKTRLALRKTGQYSGIFDAAAKIFRNEGMRSFYRGYVPNMLGIVPYAGIDLAVYETLKRRYIETHNQNEQPSFVVLLACGSISSALGQLCSYPLALVRTRLQAQAFTADRRRTMIPLMAAPSVTENPNATMTGQFRRIVNNEGLAGLYRGITPNFLKVLPAVSISYVVYEYSSRALGIKMT